LQALNLMNDVTYVEAARALAERVMREGPSSPAERLTLAFRLLTCRKPSPPELSVLVAAYESHLARYRDDLESARQLIVVGESKPDGSLDTAELASCTALTSLMLNLDEVVTKE
jgi:hypothetical protein